MKIGLELTFVPDLPGRDKEYASKRDAERAAKALNRALWSTNMLAAGRYQTIFVAKVDPFRKDDSDEFNRWIIEVTNGHYPIESAYWRIPHFVSLVQRVFDEARKLKLLPRIRRRGIHWPTGGSHCHVGIAGLFLHGSHYLSNLARFEKNLYVDLANRPYIRWLFAEWFDDVHNSCVTYNEDEINNRLTADTAYHDGRCYHSICARYSYQLKAPHPTYEFRIFDACDNAKMVARDVAFVTAWVNHHISEVLADRQYEFTLKKRDFKRFKNERTAWGEISAFLCSLGLDPVDYRGAFEDNYLPRLLGGKLT